MFDRSFGVHAARTAKFLPLPEMQLWREPALLFPTTS